MNRRPLGDCQRWFAGRAPCWRGRDCRRDNRLGCRSKLDRRQGRSLGARLPWLCHFYDAHGFDAHRCDGRGGLGSQHMDRFGRCSGGACLRWRFRLRQFLRRLGPGGRRYNRCGSSLRHCDRLGQRLNYGFGRECQIAARCGKGRRRCLDCSRLCFGRFG